MPPHPPVQSFDTLSPASSASNNEHLAKILLGTLAVESEVRERAENDVNILTSEHSPAFIRSLVELSVAVYPLAPEIRAQAALVLRLHVPSFWSDVDLDTREWLKARVLCLLLEDSPSEIRRPLLCALSGLAYCVGAYGDGLLFPYTFDLMDLGKTKEKCIFDESWPEFTANLFGNLASDIPHVRRNALELVSMMADNDESNDLVPTFKKYAPAIMTGLERGLADSVPEIRIAAVYCATCIVNVVPISDELNVQTFSSPVVDILMSFVEQGQFHYARTMVEMFVDQHTSYWARSLDVFGHVLLQLTGLPEIEDNEDSRRLHRSAVEAMYTMFEDHAHCAVEACMFLCPHLFNRCLKGLLDVDDADAFREAQCSLHRLSTALGGDDITNIARDGLGDFVLSSSWQRRYAGVCAIAEIHEASVGAFKDKGDFTIIVNSVKSLQLNDPHPRVRSAAALAWQKLTSEDNG